MNRIRSAAKTLAINVAIILTAIRSAGYRPAHCVWGLRHLRIIFTALFTDSKMDLPNYDRIDWAGQYFSDNKRVTVSYFDFVVWKLDPL